MLDGRESWLGGRTTDLTTISIVMPVVALVLVANRLYWRLLLIRQFGRDDAFIVASWVFLAIMAIANLVGIVHGYGRKQSELSSEDRQMAIQMFWLNQVAYKVTINCTKVAVLCLYLRLFRQKWFCWLCRAQIVTICLYAAGSILVTLFQCIPIARIWDKSVPGQCINIMAFWYTNAIFNIVTDGIVVLLVPFVAWKLELSLSQRIQVTVMFMLVSFISVASILRLTTLKPSSKSTDITYGTYKSTVWTTAEASGAIICACLPMLKQPLKNFRYWIVSLIKPLRSRVRPSPPSYSSSTDDLPSRSLGARSFANTAESGFSYASSTTPLRRPTYTITPLERARVKPQDDYEDIELAPMPPYAAARNRIYGRDQGSNTSLGRFESTDSHLARLPPARPRESL